jgi:hypothetical protein
MLDSVEEGTVLGEEKAESRRTVEDVVERMGG